MGSPSSSCLSPPSSSSPASSSSSQNEAIQFELSIRFNGRTYTATRPLQSFLTLRRDLLDELSQAQQSSTVIPDLWHHGMSLVGRIGCGFRGLQASVSSLRPHVESWIQTVAQAVPSSP